MGRYKKFPEDWCLPEKDGHNFKNKKYSQPSIGTVS